MDVGDVRIVEQRLDPPEAEHFGEHRIDERRFLGFVQRVEPLGEVFSGESVEISDDHAARQFAFVIDTERQPSGRSPTDPFAGECLADGGGDASNGPRWSGRQWP